MDYIPSFPLVSPLNSSEEELVGEILGKIAQFLCPREIPRRSRQAIADSKFLRFFTRHGFTNLSIFARVNIVPIKNEAMQQIRHEINQLKAKFPQYCKGASDIDILISAMAKIMECPVVSFDNHIQRGSKQLLSCDPVWPDDLVLYRRINTAVVDTNVFLNMIWNKDPHRREMVQKMFARENTELYVPEGIIEELERVYNREQNKESQRTKKAQKRANDRESMEDYVDYGSSKKYQQVRSEKRRRNQLNKVFAY